jgi:hypothetical protein
VSKSGNLGGGNGGGGGAAGACGIDIGAEGSVGESLELKLLDLLDMRYLSIGFEPSMYISGRSSDDLCAGVKRVSMLG